MCDIYSLRKGEMKVAEYYKIMKSKWEDTNYLWSLFGIESGRTEFLFSLEELHDDYENIMSQILNSGNLSNIEEVYSKVEVYNDWKATREPVRWKKYG